MADTVKKETSSQDKKSKSGFSNLKKKLNIPRIYKKLASKLSIHGRHLRSLTNSWDTVDLHSLVSQYELMDMLKELSDVAEMARSLPRRVFEDLLVLQKENFLCDLQISCYRWDEEDAAHKLVESVHLHSVLFSNRTSMFLPWNDAAAVQRDVDDHEIVLDFNFSELFGDLPSDIECSYHKTTKHLKLKSKHAFPSNFLKDVISHVYGENIYPTKAPSSLHSNSSNSSFVLLIEDKAHLYNTSKLLVDLKDNLNVSDYQKTVSPKSNSEFIGRRFTDELRSSMKDLLLSANISGDVKLMCATSPLSSAVTNFSRFRLASRYFHCHSFVISARSKFFRNMIQRRFERNDPTNDSASPHITIELDKRVLSPRYIPVVIYAMYTDELDLQRIAKNYPLSPNRGGMESLSMEIKDLTELLHIGKFLEFPFLIQACENALMGSLNVSNFTDMLHWSSQPHGSPWLRRQVMRFAKENFLQLSTSGALYSLSSSNLAELVSSDFVNAPELEVLRTVLKWGEHELLRRIELREPNVVRSHILLNQSSRNLRVSSSRRRDLLLAGNNEELHDITSCLLRFVRLRHVLPLNHEVLSNATKRGVISSPPQHLLEWHHHAGSEDGDSSRYWIRSKAGPDFHPPRLFPPYFSEAKAILKERVCQETIENVNAKSRRSDVSGSNSLTKSSVPDALYMVGSVRHLTRQTSAPPSFSDKCSSIRVGVTSMATKRLKYIDISYPAPRPSLASKLLTRERLLRQSGWIRKVLQACQSNTVATPYCCCNSSVRNSFIDIDGVKIRTSTMCDLCRAEDSIRLMVVRESDLPDITVDILKRPHVYYDADELAAASLEVTKSDDRDRFKSALPDRLVTTSSPKRLEKLFRKKSLSLKKRSSKEPVKQSVFETSKADMSLSDDSSSEWPFPYRSASMRDRTQPGSSFWDSDTSIRTPPLQTVVPDVAASADSTMVSMRSRFSSSSSSDSCASVPCRLVAESQPQEDLEESEDASRRFYTGRNTFTFLSYRKTTAPSYAHYLSLRKSSSDRRRSGLSNLQRFADLSANQSTPKTTSQAQTSETEKVLPPPNDRHHTSATTNPLTSVSALYQSALLTNPADVPANNINESLKESF